MPSTEFSTFIHQINSNLAIKHQKGSSQGFRIRTKLAVREKEGRLAMGLFQEGSHQLEEQYVFVEHHEKINEATLLLVKRLQEFGIKPYSEKNHSGELRYVQLTFSPLTQSIQLVLVINGKEISQALEKAILSLVEPIWHSVWINSNPNATNAIFGPLWSKCSGLEFLEIPFLENHYLLHPASFVQANLQLFETLVDDLKKSLHQPHHLLELYSGIGIIGFSLLEKNHSLTLIELNPFAKLALDEMKKRNFFPHHLWKYATGDAKSFLEDPSRDFLIVDPPRKGLSPQLNQQIIDKTNLEHMAYISCNLTTFCRDAALLAPHFDLLYASSYEMFPGTDHLETLTLWKRKS